MTDEIEEQTDLEYYEEIIREIFHKLRKFEVRLNDMVVSFEDSQRATAVGLQNVYDKFVELEERQKSIEELLQSDHIQEIVKLIPKEDDILRMLNKIDTSSVARLKEKINKFGEDLEKLVDRFTF